MCLNPYSTGIWSATRIQRKSSAKGNAGLNPYSTGIWSATILFMGFNDELTWVLILILLEYGLQHHEQLSFQRDLTVS